MIAHIPCQSLDGFGVHHSTFLPALVGPGARFTKHRSRHQQFPLRRLLAFSEHSLDAPPVAVLRIFVRIQAHSPLSIPCHRPADIGLTQLSTYLNPLDLPPVYFQMAAWPELRHLAPHLKFQGLNATTGSPLPMSAGLRLVLCNCSGPARFATDAKHLQ